MSWGQFQWSMVTFGSYNMIVGTTTGPFVGASTGPFVGVTTGPFVSFVSRSNFGDQAYGAIWNGQQWIPNGSTYTSPNYSQPWGGTPINDMIVSSLEDGFLPDALLVSEISIDSVPDIRAGDVLYSENNTQIEVASIVDDLYNFIRKYLRVIPGTPEDKSINGIRGDAGSIGNAFAKIINEDMEGFNTATVSGNKVTVRQYV
jgi:hypothetical protein